MAVNRPPLLYTLSLIIPIIEEFGSRFQSCPNSFLVLYGLPYRKLNINIFSLFENSCNFISFRTRKLFPILGMHIPNRSGPLLHKADLGAENAFSL